jgi:hypothetical protein
MGYAIQVIMNQQIVFSPHMRTVMDPVLETVFKILEYMMMDKVLKPNDSECYSPSLAEL